LMYVQDFDERTPIGQTGPWYITPHCAVFPYVKNKQVYVCPSKKLGNSYNADEVDQPWTGNWNRYGNYSVNNYFSYGRAMADVLEPARSVYWHDGAVGFDGWYGGTDYWAASHTTYTSHGETVDCFLQGWSVQARHSEGANLSFMDGHVKWLMRDRCNRIGLYDYANPAD